MYPRKRAWNAELVSVPLRVGNTAFFDRRNCNKFYLQSCLGQNTTKGTLCLRIMLPTPFFSALHGYGGSFTLLL